MWEAARPLSDFANVGVDLYVDTNSNRIYSRISDPNFWAVTEEIPNTFTGVLTKAFKKVMYKSEAVQLVTTISGAKEILIATVVGKAEMSDQLETSFQLELIKDRFLVNKTLFKGAVPAGLVQKSGNQFVIAMGKLPGVDVSDLKKGVTLKIKFTANRAFSESLSTQQVYSTKFEVK